MRRIHVVGGGIGPPPSAASDPLTAAGVPFTVAYGLYEASGNRAVTLGTGPTLVDSEDPVGSTTGLHSDLSSSATKGIGVKPFLSASGADAEALSPLTSSFSVSFFYTCTAGDTLAPLMWWEDDASNATLHIYDRYNSGGLKLGWYVKDSAGTNATKQITSPGTARHHLVAQIDKTANKLRLWIDGAEQTPAVDWAGGSVNLGAVGSGLIMFHASAAYASTSTLQDLVIYKGLWTSDQISALYNSGSSIDLNG